MYYVYILFLKTNELYKGYTDNLRRRFRERNQGLVDATRNKRPIELIYYEAYQNKSDAIRREIYFKTGWGRDYVKKFWQIILKIKTQKIRRVVAHCCSLESYPQLTRV